MLNVISLVTTNKVPAKMKWEENQYVSLLKKGNCTEKKTVMEEMRDKIIYKHRENKQ